MRSCRYPGFHYHEDDKMRRSNLSDICLGLKKRYLFSSTKRPHETFTSLAYYEKITQYNLQINLFSFYVIHTN